MIRIPAVGGVKSLFGPERAAACDVGVVGVRVKIGQVDRSADYRACVRRCTGAITSGMMATIIAKARAKTPWRWRDGGKTAAPIAAVERWLEAERDHLFLWLPVALGGGIALWFVLPDRVGWITAMLGLAGVAAAAVALDAGHRAARMVAIGAVAALAGLALIWLRAERAATGGIARPIVVRAEARVERVEPLPPRGLIRLRLAPIRVAGVAGQRPLPPLPPHWRVNLRAEDAPTGISTGAVIRLGVRLLPPPEPAVPGGYDYARVAWFDGVGATGRGFAPVTLLHPGAPEGDLRARLSAHIQAQSPGSPGAIAAALATGDQGAIALDDADAMRRAGLAHLLSVSGLHITAVVGATMLVVLRLLALSPWLALRVRLPLVAAGAGAAAAIGYTLLTGAEVPTVRSCVASLLVVLAVLFGRRAVTLRLVASGALVILLLWPDSLAGPSFQLSFAAVAAIVALHETPVVRGWFVARDEAWGRRLLRELASLLLTGVVVEAALAPIGIYHFHRAGFYGSLANIVAIPLTTFVIMPLEAAALAFDLIGIGAPLWWLTTLALRLLLLISHLTADAPGAVQLIPSMPVGAYALLIGGLLCLGLWRTRVRLAGVPLLLAGAVWTLITPAPDLLVTGDGRHLALRTPDGGLALLRDRAGDYTQAMLAENSGVDGTPLLLDEQDFARCSADLCLADVRAGQRRWRIVATRSAYRLDAAALAATCRDADIVVSDRRLPRGCLPRWLKLDRTTLARTGGVAISFAGPSVRTVRQPGDQHPWHARFGEASLKRPGRGVLPSSSRRPQS